MVKSYHFVQCQPIFGVNNLSELGAQWTNLTQDMEYSKSNSALCAYIPKANTRPIEMGLNRTAWVNLDRLHTGIGHFSLSMHKWGLASSANCEGGASDQKAWKKDFR